MKSLLAVILIGSFFVAGCASHPNKNLVPYITGEGLDEASADEIRANLTRIGFMAGGQYEFQVTPITRPLILAEVRQLAALRGLSAEEQKTIETTKLDELYNNKTCVDFKISVVKFNQVSGLNQWKIEVVNEKGTTYPLRWSKKSLGRKPLATYINGLYGKEGKWLNEGRGCADVSLNLAGGVIFKVTPSYVQWPFPNSTSLSWGTALETSHQDYRGY